MSTQTIDTGRQGTATHDGEAFVIARVFADGGYAGAMKRAAERETEDQDPDGNVLERA